MTKQDRTTYRKLQAYVVVFLFRDNRQYCAKAAAERGTSHLEWQILSGRELEKTCNRTNLEQTTPVPSDCFQVLRNIRKEGNKEIRKYTQASVPSQRTFLFFLRSTEKSICPDLKPHRSGAFQFRNGSDDGRSYTFVMTANSFNLLQLFDIFVLNSHFQSRLNSVSLTSAEHQQHVLPGLIRTHPNL
jgi:hypothetical protein